MNIKRNSLFANLLREDLTACGITNWEVFHVESTESTNDLAKELLQDYPSVVVLADVQTKGRGTQGRIWESPPGGVWMSVGTRGKFPIKDYASLVAEDLANVISDILDEDCVHKPINDIMIRGKKLAGILVETKITGEFITELIVGVGVNVFNDIPDYLSDRAISMKTIGLSETFVEVAKDIAMELIFLIRAQNHS